MPDKTIDDDDRTTRWLDQLETLARAAEPIEKPEKGINYLSYARKLIKRAEREEWSPKRRSALFVYLALISQGGACETDALKLIKEQEVSHSPKDQKAFAYLVSELQNGAGVNCCKAGKFAEAVGWYSRAIEGFVLLGVKSRIVDCLASIEDLMRRHPQSDVAVAVCLGLVPNVLKIEAALGSIATNFLQRICETCTATLSISDIDPNLLSIFWQAAKGHRFATALGRGAPSLWHFVADRWNPIKVRLEKEAHTLASAGISLRPADKDLVLASYAESRGIQPVKPPRNSVASQRPEVDAQLNELLTWATAASIEVAGAESVFISCEQIQQVLDARTVLVNFYLGRSLDGELNVYAMLFTQEEVAVSVVKHQAPAGLFTMTRAAASIVAHPLAFLTEQVRRQIRMDPVKGQPVTADVKQTMVEMLEGFFGSLKGKLESFRKSGKDHLCIVPHGPLHYFPFHLLGSLEKPLGSDWIITYLPNLYLLGLRHRQPRGILERTQLLTAVGIDFKAVDSVRLPPLLGAVSEATSIAEIFGTKPFLNGEATFDLVVAALRSSRYMHFASHGELDADAPAFQCIFLDPACGYSSQLCSFHLLPMDLRGLHLVTLSACETALGRFDLGDNLQGLPASFFLAGVSAIVGTMWEVETETSECFFTALYRSLKQGSKRLDAFAAAQRLTRERHMEYRDWGAFYYMGDWGEEKTTVDQGYTVPGIPGLTVFDDPKNWLKRDA